MRLSPVWAAAFAAAGLSLQSTPLLAQNPSVEDELRKEIQELHNRLEQLEKKLDQQSAPPATAVPVQPAQAQPSDHERELQQRVEDLDQQVKVLGRKQELDQEDKAAEKKERPTFTANERGLEVKSADGQNAFRLRGVLQTDGRFFLGESIGTDTFLLRKVRPIFEGTLNGIYDFKFVPDFGGGKAVVQDAYVNARFKSYANVIVGKMKQPIGLERLQLDVDTRFVERAFPTDVAPNRDIGIDLHGDLLNRTLEYDVGLFNGALDGGSSDSFTPEQDNNSDKDWALRLFAHPFRNVPSPLQGLGVGLSASFSDAVGSSPAAGTATNQQTNLPTYITPAQLTFFNYRNTGPSATFSSGERIRWSPQGYWYYGPFGLLAEYIIEQQDVSRNVSATVHRKNQLTNSAWEVQLTYLLTGEDESFDGVKPARPFRLGAPGWGAFELAARYSELSIDDGAFSGGAASYADKTVSAGAAREWSAGLNWYLNWNVKLQLDYSRTRFDGGGGGTLAAPKDRVDEQLIFGRIQLGF
ncbi:MAG: porin [Proteobacteria bacterium]|nr:MAG: porin [Pseudomonadota bacterium]